MALVHFLDGNTRRAIATFELVARDPASQPAALTDLSAAYLARFQREGDCLDLLRAIYAAEHALAVQPANSVARFDRATALSLLGARHLAAKAWREVDREDTGGWRGEADEHLRELQQPPIDEQWARVVARIEAPDSSQSDVETVTAQFPANARAFGEEVVLPRWAAAITAGDVKNAERSLSLAARIGETLARRRGEFLLSDAVGAVRRTMDRGSGAERQALLLGLQQFGTGVADYNEQNVASARVPLTDAARNLVAADNPLRFWARLFLAIIEYYADAARGLGLVDGILREVREDRYPAIVGRAEWVAGTADKVQGRIQSSVHRYEHAATDLRLAGGEPAAAFVSVLLAESDTLLGEHSLAWENRKRAFHQVALSEGPRRNVAMWTEAKEALLRQGSLRLAGPLVEEAVAYADAERRPLSRAAALLDRAVYRLEVGNRDGALSDLFTAQAAISQMEPSALRDQMAYLALITEGLCDRATDPAKAADLLRRGLESQRATGTRFDAITYTTALADAEIAAGNVSAGARSLERALTIFEDIRATVEDPVSRMHAFRQAQPAFDRLIDLRTTVQPADREAPFLLAERSRARVLLEMVTSRGAASDHVEFARLADLETTLPRGVALASYAVLDDRILVWVVEDGHARRLNLQSKRADVENAVERFRLELERAAAVAAINEAAAPLYEMLIRPLNLRPGGGSLIVVPDRWLSRLPFAALFDHRTGQYLIEQRTVTIAPSATLLLRNSREIARAKSLESSVVAVGVSNSGSHRGASLSALPFAEQEAKAVASTYANSSLLVGPRGTRQNFLRLSVSSDVIHFAGHAVVDLDAPRRSVLLFRSASGASLEPLSLGELFDAGVGKASLVVLSACRTQDSLADDREGLLGLAGAFVAAGVREVVASSLDVDDSSAPVVMAAFHRHFRRCRSAGVAYRRAVLDLLRSGAVDARSPAAWGGFTVIEGTIDEGGNR